jgi:alpha-amylase
VPNNESFRGMMFAPHDEYLANVYVLGRDGGVPMIYSDHGESNLSHPDDAYRWQDLWRRADLAAMLAFHNALHGAAERLLYVNAVVLVLARGARGMVAINKSADWQTAPLAAHGLQLGTYVCQLHGHHLTITGEAQQLQIPPRQAQMWLFASS